MVTGSLVRLTGLEPVRSPTRPSNVRVCLFRHNRANIYIIAPKREMSSLLYKKISKKARGRVGTARRQEGVDLENRARDLCLPLYPGRGRMD